MSFHCNGPSRCRRAFYTFLWSHARSRQQTAYQVFTGIGGASFGRRFYVLTGHDVVGYAQADLQRPLSQSHGSSLDEWHGASNQTSEQTYPTSVLTALWHRQSSVERLPPVGCNNRYNSFFRTDRSCDAENEASPSPCRVRMARHARYRLLYRFRLFQTPCATRASTERARNVSRSLSVLALYRNNPQSGTRFHDVRVHVE